MKQLALLSLGLLSGCGSSNGPYQAVAPIIAKHCVACHAVKPTNTAYDTPPLGISFESPEDVKKMSVRIKALVVTTHSMPLGNSTGMSDTERAALGKWIDEGAKIE